MSYIALIRNELTVGENQGNIKFVAIQSKDPQSKGYNENIRTNLTINGSVLTKEQIVRKDWGEYGATVIPIFTADARDNENQTLEIQSEQPIKSLNFEYSSYDFGGYLQVYLDDKLYMQINSYNGDELIYKPISLKFDQHYAITKSNGIWWGQLALFAILLLIYLFKLNKNKQQSGSIITAILVGLVTYLLAKGSLELAFRYGESKDFYFFNTFTNPTIQSLLLISLIILSNLVKKKLPELKQYRLGFLGQLYYLIVNGLAPFLGLYLIETAYSIKSIHQLSPSDYQANILILIIIWTTIAFLTTSIKAASFILVAGSMIVGMVTKILLIARNMPLLSYHFLQVRDGLSVAGNTDFHFTSNMFALIFISWLYLISVFYLPKFSTLFDYSILYKKSNAWTKVSNQFNSFQRKIIQKSIVISIGLSSLLFFAKPAIYAVANSVDLSLYFWTLQSTYYDHGLPVALTRYHIAAQIQKPEGYSTKVAEDILSQYPKMEVNSKEKPNIIFILNESLTDYSQLTNLEFSSDPLEFYHSLEKNTIKGSTVVSVFAGSTANTEYEALTGNSMAILPPNSFPFQQLISSPKNSIVNNLKNQGYSTFAFHPYGKDNYRRSQVYGYLGFDQSYFENSKPAFKDLIENPERVRGYISDAALYEGSLKLIKDNEEPIFNFIVTMQGHGGYNNSEEAFPRTISITNAENDPSATDFLSSVDASDKAFKKLVEDLEKSDEPSIVVMFGDHHPILSDSYFKPYLDSSDPKSRYQTPFIIWANFDLPSIEETTISPNYLTPYLMQVLSQTEYALPISPFYQFLSKVQEEIPVMTTWGYYDSNYNYSEIAPTSQLYKDYQYVQYNNVIDKKSIQMTEYYQ
ncbi:LTA synthase family protein [Streptococcus rifensis]